MSSWRPRPVLLPIAAALLLTGTGCSAGTDPVDDPPLTLRMAHVDAGPGHDPAVEWFAERLDELSDGRLRVDVIRECCSATAEVEEALVESVAAGQFELGWVGTRVFAGLGVTSFQALTAPLLLDSYAVQEAVITSDIPAQMLGQLEGLGVTGLAVVPGALRRPISSDHPLLGPEDWKGVTFHVFTPSDSAATSITALGATPIEAGFGERDEGLFDGSIQGLENSMFFDAPAVQRSTPFLTVNVNLWPRISALLIDPDVLSGLTDTQTAWLHEAAADVARRTSELRELEAAALADGCRSGARYAVATQDHLAAMTDAMSAVYDRLGQDPQTRAFIERIRELKQDVTPEAQLDIPDGCGADVPAVATGSEETGGWEGATIPEGSYAKTVSREQALAAGVPSTDFGDATELRITYRFKDGRWLQLANYGGGPDTVGDRGTYVYDGQGRLLITSDSSGCDGCRGVVEWSMDGDVLTMEIDWDDAANDGLGVLGVDPAEKSIVSLMVSGTYTKVD